jgi:hypothetical protein
VSKAVKPRKIPPMIPQMSYHCVSMMRPRPRPAAWARVGPGGQHDCTKFPMNLGQLLAGDDPSPPPTRTSMRTGSGLSLSTTATDRAWLVAHADTHGPGFALKRPHEQIKKVV